MKMYKIPVSKVYGEFHDQWCTHRGLVKDNDTYYYPMPLDETIGGKLVRFCLGAAAEPDQKGYLALPVLSICSGQTKEQEILRNEQHRLTKCSDLDALLDRCEILADTKFPHDDLLSTRELFTYKYQPLSILTVTPSAWFMMEIRRARSQGLIYSVNGKTPPKPILESMGRDVLHYVRKNHLI